MAAPVLLFAIGNESRGDDALGPLLSRELDAWLKLNTFAQSSSPIPPPTPPLKGGEFSLPPFVSTPHQAGLIVDCLPLVQGEGWGGDGLFEHLEDFQLQIEHAMDMKDRRLVLFIDAGMDTPAPFSFYRAQTKDEPVLYSHALAPEVLLKVYEQFYQEAPPDVFILCIRGERFELGEALSPLALEHLAQALEFAKKLLQIPEIASWDCYVRK